MELLLLHTHWWIKSIDLIVFNAKFNICNYNFCRLKSSQHCRVRAWEMFVSLHLGLLHVECVMLNGRLLNGWHHFGRLYVALHTIQFGKSCHSSSIPHSIHFQIKLEHFHDFMRLFFGPFFSLPFVPYSIICGPSSKRILNGREKKNEKIYRFCFSIGEFGKYLFVDLL